MHNFFVSYAASLSYFAVINLLVYGSDLKTIHQLLVIASSLASCSIHHNSRNDLIATYRKNRLGKFVDGNFKILCTS